jgi:hypothetical protein
MLAGFEAPNLRYTIFVLLWFQFCTHVFQKEFVWAYLFLAGWKMDMRVAVTAAVFIPTYFE